MISKNNSTIINNYYEKEKTPKEIMISKNNSTIINNYYEKEKTPKDLNEKDIINNLALKFGFDIENKLNELLSADNKKSSLYFENIFNQIILVDLVDKNIDIKIYKNDLNKKEEIVSLSVNSNLSISEINNSISNLLLQIFNDKLHLLDNNLDINNYLKEKNNGLFLKLELYVNKYIPIFDIYNLEEYYNLLKDINNLIEKDIESNLKQIYNMKEVDEILSNNTEATNDLINNISR